MKRKKAQIIVVSGVTASGKTTFIREAAKLQSDIAVLSFDDYSIDALPSAPSFAEILREPYQAINRYDIQLLLEDLRQTINQYAFILIDFPFGYLHNQLSPYIDKVIYLKTPLDIVLGRQIIRDFQQQPEAIIDWISIYLEGARSLFVQHEQIVSPQADYIRDGRLPLQEQMIWFKQEILLKEE